MAIDNRIWLIALPASLMLAVPWPLSAGNLQGDTKLAEIGAVVVYPLEAIALHSEGTVELRVTVDNHGDVAAVQVAKSSTFPLLDDAAVGSTYQWVFKTNLPKKPSTQVDYVIPVRFQITETTLKELPKDLPSTIDITKTHADVRIRHYKQPIYPYRARVRRLKGATVLGLTISERGFVSSADIVKSSGYTMLDYSAILSVYQSAFDVRFKDGQPVPYRLRVPVEYKMRN